MFLIKCKTGVNLKIHLFEIFSDGPASPCTERTSSGCTESMVSSNEKLLWAVAVCLFIMVCSIEQGSILDNCSSVVGGSNFNVNVTFTHRSKV